MTCCCPVTWTIVAVAGYVIYRFLSKKNKEPEILEKEWKKDVVYLYQFPPAKTVRNLSPYCMKLEAFLRIYDIKYEVRDVIMKRSRHGLLPFVELNGEHIADSQIIQERLKQHFKTPKLAPKDEGAAAAVERLVEHHLAYLMYKFKVLNNLDQSVEVFVKPLTPDWLWPLARCLAKPVMKHKISKKLNVCLGDFSNADCEMLLRRDFNAVRDVLGSNKFLGGDKPTAVDATVFGHFAAVYYVNIASLPKTLLDTEYSVIREYLDRVRDLLFPKDFTTSS
ncbi:unnamed protein product [Caenorhabditis auriculariae]|uniref:Uncharacterized protein n=1 Tax=Caenorhabditis auriculariae TaxID=2777116 RepID=A0A8S1GZU4_9PELO|nr:unnamed protein product [Caenorhabditis auriculariae]